ncbi:MAG: FKBP-type peptidyl-prolyl cis-trans isomerase [Saprospiraceae bacterium]
MRNLLLFTIVILLASCTPKTTAEMTDAAKSATDTATSVANIKEATMDTLSYSVGVLVAQNLKQQGLDKVNSADLAKAIEDVIAGNDLKVDMATANQNVQTYMKEAQERALKENEAKGVQFLADNKTKEGVQVTESGLQYKVITEGTGNMPKVSDEVTVHYEGTLIDGTVFDSSYKRGQPTSFPLNGVIKGWTEGLQLMKEGAKYRFYIPSELAYGARGAGGQIGPNSTLVFDVELIEIK